MSVKIKNEIEITSSIIEEAIELVKNNELPLEDFLNILNSTKAEVKKLSKKREVTIIDVLKSALN